MTAPLYAEASLELNRHIVNLLDSLSALHGLTEISLRNQDEPQLLKGALEALMANQDMERCSIFLLDKDGTLTNAAGLDWDDMLKDIVDPDEIAAQRPPGKTYRLGEGLMGRTAQSGAIEHCRSCADDPQFKQFGIADKAAQGSLICVPIACENQVLGVLNVYYPVPDFFNLWHERLLLLFCKILGRLLLNHRFMHHLGTLVEQRTRELASQRQFLQSVIDGMPDPMMVIGTDYRVILSNHPGGESGLQAAGQEPRFCYQISHRRETPCDSKEHPCPLEAALKSDKPAAVIHEHFNAAGEARHVELLASPLKDRDGKVFAIIESARDITERLNTDRALRELNETLESRVSEEVARNLENERLMIQQARLAAMGEMIGNIAHQWRQPINALTLILSNIKDAYEYDELDKPYLDAAVGKGRQLIQNMSNTIDDFRNFFKPNKLKRNFSLRQAVEDTLNLLRHSFKNNGIALAVEESEDFEASGFQNEFSQVLLNVLSNAKDAIHERTVADGRVDIRLGRDGERVYVALKDNAGGIAEEVLPRIFDPYFSTKETGTGIGLYMSRMVMENMGGAITARNAENGAEFTLTLPAAEASG